MLIGTSCRKRAARRCRQKHKAPGRVTRPGALTEPKGYAPDLGSEQAPQVISRKLTLGCCSLRRNVVRAYRLPVNSIPVRGAHLTQDMRCVKPFEAADLRQSAGRCRRAQPVSTSLMLRS